MPEMITDRNMAVGAVLRGSLVSSARSADPSQPSSVYTGSSSASPIVVMLTGLPVVEPTWTSTLGPCSWWKNSRPIASTTVSPSVPITLTATAATIAMAANSAMSPCVGTAQISGENTLAMATAIDAVPTKNDSSAVHPLNQP